MASSRLSRLTARHLAVASTGIGAVGFAATRSVSRPTPAEEQFHVSSKNPVPKDWRGRIWQIRNDYPTLPEQAFVQGGGGETDLPVAQAPELPMQPWGLQHEAPWLQILLTDATDEELPNLKDSPSMNAVIARSPNDPIKDAACPKKRNEHASKLRLLQVDFAVRDDRSPIGWIFGTFMYNGDKCEKNTTGEQRMTQPAPQYVGDKYTPVNDRETMNWFRNIPAGQPFSDNTPSGDYSLQLMIGFHNYHHWIRSQKKSILGLKDQREYILREEELLGAVEKREGLRNGPDMHYDSPG
ncbi:hypothetical protein IFM5058_09806 [Aspergillus udagawae]|nr:hypothetical protein IFM5058_09806 [Aspergillus udagawae]